MLKRIVVIALIAWGSWYGWQRHAANAAVMLAPDDPVQADLVVANPFDFHGYRITPLADFKVKARVLSATSYSAGREADLSPVDLALGWGPMSEGNVLGKLDISQADRRYYYRWSGEPPVAQQTIETHSANMHIIPADATVRQQLEKAHAGDVVEFEGQLVAIQAPDGWHWQSSTTREDTGDGACEVVLVKSLKVR